MKSIPTPTTHKPTEIESARKRVHDLERRISAYDGRTDLTDRQNQRLDLLFRHRDRARQRLNRILDASSGMEARQ